MTDGPFDPAQLHVIDSPIDAAIDDAEDAITPDHTASNDSESVIDRVRRQARESRSTSKSTRTTRTRKTKTKPRATKPGELVEPITQIYAAAGMALMPFDLACGTAVMQNAESCAKSLDELARHNDAVRRAILALTQSSAWGGVLIAHLPILAVVMVHHGPASVADTVGPYVKVDVPDDLGGMGDMGE